MLDFSFTEEQERVREMVCRFCEAKIAPLASEAGGGAGMDEITDCFIREEMSVVSQGFASAWSAHTHLGIWPIWRAGTDDQKERFFRPALAGEKVAAFRLSEPEVGSNVRGLKTRAEKVEGGWKFNGSKMYITNAPIADFILLAARTDPELSASAISLFIVELPNLGFDVVSLKKEGIRASETGLIYIEDAFVPDDCLLGGETGTYPIILESLLENRVGVAANAVGIARAALQASLTYAQERQIGCKRVGDFQAIQHKLADMVADIEAAKWIVYHAAWRMDQGSLDGATASKAKLIASETALRVTENDIRIHDGAEIMPEFPVGRYHRDALVYVIGEGTSEIQRNIIARDLGF
ncbi:MAG: acyl-CoA dehydrogenase family protein [Alphaproteobacteria bacterium]|nr:acyl-CoA dehydrogenase family protein [Alphaproteobacteria bacterium]